MLRSWDLLPKKCGQDCSLTEQSLVGSKCSAVFTGAYLREGAKRIAALPSLKMNAKSKAQPGWILPITWL